VPDELHLDTLQIEATRMYTVYWNGKQLDWTEYTTGLDL
jgi:hypothetical protein